MTQPIPFPLSSSPGETTSEGAGRLVNCFAEPLGATAAHNTKLPPVRYRRSAGLKSYATSAYSGPRGFIEVSGTVFQALSGKLVSFAGSGAATDVGTLAGTARVYFARNNKQPTPDKVVVTENGAFKFTGSSVADYNDSDLPQPNSVSFQDGYFFFTIGDGRIFASDINDTNVNALNFAKAEGKPDSLLRGVPFNSQMYFFGAESTEVWYDTANATGFPYSRRIVIPRGLIGANALAGHEDGFGHQLIFVADDNSVRRFTNVSGDVPEKISPPDLDRLIAAVTDKTTLEASVHVSGGHAYWTLSAGTAWTWEFDTNTAKWHEKQSYGLLRWRGSTTVKAFGLWLCGDTQTGGALQIDELTRTEMGQPLRFRLESGPVENFPSRTAIPFSDFWFSPGTGSATGSDPIETNPMCMVSWSDDNGDTWSIPRIRPLGAQAVGDARVKCDMLGMSSSYGRRYRLDVTDPVHVAFLKGVQSSEPRNR